MLCHAPSARLAARLGVQGKDASHRLLQPTSCHAHPQTACLPEQRSLAFALRRPRRSAAGDPRSCGLAPDHLAVSRTSGDAALDGASPASTVSPPALPREGGRPAEPLLTGACAPRRCRPRTRTCDTASDALCRPRKAPCRPADMLPRARAGSPAVASTTAASPVQSAFHRLGAPCPTFAAQDTRHRARRHCRLEPASGVRFTSPTRGEARPSRPELSLRRVGRPNAAHRLLQTGQLASIHHGSIEHPLRARGASSSSSSGVGRRPSPASDQPGESWPGAGAAVKPSSVLRPAIARGEALPQPARPGHLSSLARRGAGLEGPAPRPRRFLGGVSPVVGELLWSPACFATTLVARATLVASPPRRRTCLASSGPLRASSREGGHATLHPRCLPSTDHLWRGGGFLTGFPQPVERSGAFVNHSAALAR